MVTRGLGNNSRGPCLTGLSNKATGCQDSLLFCNPYSKNLRHGPQGQDRKENDSNLNNEKKNTLILYILVWKVTLLRKKKSRGPTYMVCPVLSIKVKVTYISVDTCKYLLSVDRKCQEGWTMVIMQRDVAVKTEERSFISYFNNLKRCGAFIHDFILFLNVFFKYNMEIEHISFCDSQCPQQGHCLQLLPQRGFLPPQGLRQLSCPSFAGSPRAAQL